MSHNGVVIRLNRSTEADAKLHGAAELLSALAFDHRLAIARALQSGSTGDISSGTSKEICVRDRASMGSPGFGLGGPSMPGPPE